MQFDNDAAARCWREDGYAILPAYIPAEDLARGVADLPMLYPTADAYHDQVDPERNRRFDDEFGGIDDFPFPGAALSLLAVHPRLIDLAERFLDTDDLRVYSIEAWAKYTGAADYDQELHRDYLGVSMLVPSTDPRFGQVEMFLYLVDVPAGLGPPAFVPLRHTTDLPMIPNWFPRDDNGRRDPDRPTWISRQGRPELYEHEVVAAGPAGMVVAYTNRTFHRGTQLTAPRGARYTLHINFRPAGSEWQARHSWLRHANTPAWPSFVEHASPRQLALFGWPAPGHPFWTTDTLTGVHERYPHLELAPWYAALGRRDQPGLQATATLPVPTEPRWPITDGVIQLRPPTADDTATLLAGRDSEWERWLGPGDDEPNPTAVIVAGGEIVGWIDYDTDQAWLGPGEVNMGYNVFPAYRRNHYATRAARLLVDWLGRHTHVHRAYLAIDTENAASHGVARSLNAARTDRYFNLKGRPNIRYVLDVPTQ